MTTPAIISQVLLQKEDPSQHIARVNVDKIAQQVQNYDALANAAKEGETADHRYGVWQAYARSKKAVFWSVFLSTAIVMQGYGLLIIVGFFGQQQFQKQYGKFDKLTGKWYIPAPWQAGLSNAAFCGQIMGLLCNAYALQKFGYRRTMIVALAVMSCAIFGVFFAPSLPLLFFGQFLCGIPWGIFQTLSTSYAADICPMALRPLLTSYVNMCFGFGILASSGVTRSALHLRGSVAYKLPFALQWIWPLPLLVGAIFCPESPYWLVRNNKFEEAKRSLRRLSSAEVTDAEIEKQLAMIVHTNAIEEAEIKGVNVLDCFRGTNLRRTEIGCAVFAIQNLCGGPMIGFAVTFMQQAGLDEDQAFTFNIGVMSMFCIGTVVSWSVINRFGRRTLYMSSMTLMGVMCLAIGIAGFFPNTSSAIGIMLIFLNLAGNIGIGPVCYCIISELPSSRLRPVAVILSCLTFNLMGIVVNVITPRMIQPTAWGWGARCGLFWMGTAVVSVTYCYFRLPETRNRSFAEVDALFEHRVPARKFTSTQIDLFGHLQSPHIVANSQPGTPIEMADLVKAVGIIQCESAMIDP